MDRQRSRRPRWPASAQRRPGILAIWTVLTACAAAAAADPDPEQRLAVAGAPLGQIDAIAVGWLATDCRTCHAIEDPLFSHPIDVRPSMAVPAHLPLGDGRLTCTTCHQDDLAAHGRSRQTHDPLLREGAAGAAFCTQCHAQGTLKRSQMHGVAIGKAHLGPPRSGAAAPRQDAALVETASQCLSCHDGMLAPGLGKSHPVGVEYGREGSRPGRRRRLNLAPADRLDRRVRLFDRKVECGSCHSLFSGLEKLLVMPNRRDQLCLSCHRMR